MDTRLIIIRFLKVIYVIGTLYLSLHVFVWLSDRYISCYSYSLCVTEDWGRFKIVVGLVVYFFVSLIIFRYIFSKSNNWNMKY